VPEPPPAPSLATPHRRLILASGSPQRLALLRQLGYEPDVRAVDIDESPLTDEAPATLARRLARAKAAAAVARTADTATTGGRVGRVSNGDTIVLAADTVIDLDGQVLGKPRDADHGVSMLLALGGREHRVLTGLCLVYPIGRAPRTGPVGIRTLVVSTRVRMGRITTDAALRYRDSGEPAGKAGGYAIQGSGARFVAGIVGSYSNVVGLPLHEGGRLLAAAGIER